MKDDSKTTQTLANGLQANSPPALTLDWERFGVHLEESDLTDAQKREFIETMWSLVVSFVDLGLGLHPLQRIMGNPCEQDGELARLIADQSSPVVDLKPTPKPEFKAAAAGDMHLGRESDLR